MEEKSSSFLPLETELINEFNSQSFDNILTNNIKFGRFQHIAIAMICKYLLFECLISKNIFFVAMILITDGAEALVLSFLTPVLQLEWNLTQFQESVLGSSTFVGYFIGCLLSGQFADRYGRRLPLVYGVFANFFFGFTSGLVNSLFSLVFLRLLFGVAGGIITPLSATYLSEISPQKIRGKVLVFATIFLTVGELITCLIAYLFLDSFASGNWRALVIWSSFPGIVTFILCLLFLEESPRYLLVSLKFDHI